jgi:hypothetical protein
VRVAEKANEIPVAREVLPVLPLAGRVGTADALHTCAQTAQALLEQEADYLLVVKGNQPMLYAECAAYFSDPLARVGRATTVVRRRGRTATRTLNATTHLNAHLTRYSAFPRSAQVACLLTTTQDRRGTHRDVRFLLTSLTPQQAAPDRLLALAGDAPQFLAALRNLVHTLLRRSGVTAIAAARRSFSYHPARALPLLLAAP